MVSRFLRPLGKTTLWLMGAVAGLVLLVVAINAFDESLSPEAKRMLSAPPNALTPEQNLYLAMMGIDSLPGESTIAAGQARVTAYDKETQALTDDYMTTIARFGHDATPRLLFKGKLDCDLLGGSCWSVAKTQKEEIEGLLAANNILYQRYLDLKHFTGYYETAIPGILMRPPSVPFETRKLFLANVALRIKTATSTQQSKAALDDLHNDVLVWREMLVGNGSLISRLIAVLNLRGDFIFLGDMVSDPTIETEPLGHEIGAILDAVDTHDWQMRGVFAYEFRVTESMLDLWRHWDKSPLQRTDDAAEQSWWEPYNLRIQVYFMKIQATENLSARRYLELQQVADSNAKDFLSAEQGYRRWAQDNLEFSIKYVYNPVGRTLVGIGSSWYLAYPRRARDGEAIQRLVRLGYEIRQHKLRVDEVAAFIKAHPQLGTHPVTGEAFIWDEQKHEIAIQPAGPAQKGRRYSIPIWTADTAHS